MSAFAILGVVVGLVVIGVMALAPTLVEMNERFPPHEQAGGETRTD